MENTHLFSGNTQKNGICEVLYAAAWITGEFSEFLPEPRETIDALLNPKITALPGHIQAVFVQNIVKLYASILVRAEAEVCVCGCGWVCMCTCCVGVGVGVGGWGVSEWVCASVGGWVWPFVGVGEWVWVSGCGCLHVCVHVCVGVLCGCGRVWVWVCAYSLLYSLCRAHQRKWRRWGPCWWRSSHSSCRVGIWKYRNGRAAFCN